MKEKTKIWVEFIIRDLEVAQEIIENEHVANVVLFHCQQAIEKSIKALLEESGMEVPKIHSVVKLYNLLPSEVRKNVELTVLELNSIEEVYINFRYPSEMGIVPEGFPSRQRAKETLKIAERVVAETLKYLEQ